MPNELTSEARPSLRYLFKMRKIKIVSYIENIYKSLLFIIINLIAIGTHCMFEFLDVNGLAIEASAFDKEIPA
jgi:hypothetical protein